MDTLFPLNTNDQESLIIHGPCIKLARDMFLREMPTSLIFPSSKENKTLLSHKTSKALKSDEPPEHR